MGHRGRGDSGGLLVPIAKVRDGQGSVAGGCWGWLTVAALFAC